MRVFCILLVAISASTFAATKSVEGSVAAREYVEVLKTWNNRNISLYIDNNLNLYVSVSGGILPTRGFIKGEDISKFVDALHKSQEWSKTAAKEQLETTKPIASFMRDTRHKNGVDLQFFAARLGQQTDLVMEIVDFENQFAKATLYLNPAQVKALLAITEKIPDTYDELKKNEEKASKLK